MKHSAIAEYFLGKAYPKVDRALDKPYIYLRNKHRILYHDPISATMIGEQEAGHKGAEAAQLHLLIDNLPTRASSMLGLFCALENRKRRMKRV